MNIVRLYNQNRKKVWLAILIIASIFIALRVLNYYAGKESRESLSNESENKNITYNQNLAYGGASKANSNKSGVSGNNISTKKLEDTQNILDKFYGFCNNKELDKAYAMLSDKCKQLIYPNINLFTKNYYANVFKNQRKIYSFENWNGNTYMVTLEEDALSTGNISSATEKKVDYVTIVDDKLNISTYIGSTEINKEYTENGITIKVNSKDEYMNYVTYNFTIKNNNESTVCLADVKDSLNIYLVDNNGIRYGMYNHELGQNRTVINSNKTLNISLKFYSSYVSSKVIERIVFKNVYLNYGTDNQKENTISFNIT